MPRLLEKPLFWLRLVWLQSPTRVFKPPHFHLYIPPSLSSLRMDSATPYPEEAIEIPCGLLLRSCSYFSHLNTFLGFIHKAHSEFISTFSFGRVFLGCKHFFKDPEAAKPFISTLYQTFLNHHHLNGKSCDKQEASKQLHLRRKPVSLQVSFMMCPLWGLSRCLIIPEKNSLKLGWLARILVLE